MEKANFIFTYENRTNTKEGRFHTLETSEHNVFRGEFGEITDITNLSIIEKISSKFAISKRVSSNTVELLNSDRISWNMI